jgi:ribosomal-protein-alanine N-acetyltransferase
MNPGSKNKVVNLLPLGKRVLFRTPAADNAEELIQLNLASTRLHQGLVSPPKNKVQFEAYLERCRAIDYAGFLICRIEDKAIIGVINLSQIFRGAFQNAYLGYYIGEAFAGQGYMTEALDLMLRHAFLKLRLHRIEANIQPENIASIALVKRAGFSLEGYSRRYLKICGKWRDHERWALLTEDWKAKRSSGR